MGVNFRALPNWLGLDGMTGGRGLCQSLVPSKLGQLQGRAAAPSLSSSSILGEQTQPGPQSWVLLWLGGLAFLSHVHAV